MKSIKFSFVQERNKIIQKMSEPNRSQLAKVNESLNGKVKEFSTEYVLYFF